MVTLVNGEPPKRKTLYRKVSREDLFKSQEFHKIDEQIMLEKGLTTSDFQREFIGAVGRGTMFTFNPVFQHSFLVKVIADGTPWGNDLPLLVKAAESGLILPEEDRASLRLILERVEKWLGKSPGLKTMCQRRGLDPEPPRTVLPADYAADCLYALWQTLDSFEA